MDKYIMCFSCAEGNNEIEFHNIQTFHSYFRFPHPSLFLPPLTILKAAKKSIFNFLLFFFCPFICFVIFCPLEKHAQ